MQDLLNSKFFKENNVILVRNVKCFRPYGTQKRKDFEILFL